MTASLRKEIRLLLPAWGLALAAAVSAGVGSSPSARELGLQCFVFGSLILALAPFGQEVSMGTLGLLLSQPRARARLWRTKLGLTIAAMLLVWVVFAVVWETRIGGGRVSWNLVELGGLRALAALAGAFWTTLLFRQTIAAFWVALIVPLCLCALLPLVEDRELGTIPAGAVALPLLVYSAAGLAYARWLFLRAQDTPWTGGVISPARLRLRTSSISFLTPGKGGGPWRALAQKELGLQQVTFFLVPWLALLHVGMLLARRFYPEFAKRSLFADSIWILWLACPFVIGGVAVAEERNLNTLTAALCSPVKRLRQFLLKFGVVLAAGVFLGAVVPSLIEGFGQFIGARNEMAHWAGRPSMLVAAAAIATVSFFASSLARNSLYALGTGFVLSVAVFMYLIAGGFPFPIFHWNGLLRAVVGPVMLVALIWPAYLNFKRIELRFAWLSNAVCWTATVVVLMLITTGVYLRPWEYVMPLEPRHGAARITDFSHVRIRAAWSDVFVLRPDGRLWRGVMPNEGVPQFRPVSEGLLAGSNWVDMAVGGGAESLIAIRGDGSLWGSYQAMWPPLKYELTRIGSDSDWKSVAGGDGLLALKQDGTLWEWSRRTTRGNVMSGLFRIGHDSDWLNVFGELSRTIGVKRDGTVWRWNNSFTPEFEGDTAWQFGLTMLPIHGTNWTSIASMNFLAVAGLDDNGNLWTSRRLLDYQLQQGRLVGVKTTWESPVESHPGWRALAGGFGGLVEVGDDGRLGARNDPNQFRDFPRMIGNWKWTTLQPSKYSDWIAVAEGGNRIIALAADGTLSAWHMPEPRDAQSSLLGPTRKPVWNANIFQ